MRWSAAPPFLHAPRRPRPTAAAAPFFGPAGAASLVASPAVSGLSSPPPVWCLGRAGAVRRAPPSFVNPPCAGAARPKPPPLSHQRRAGDGGGRWAAARPGGSCAGLGGAVVGGGALSPCLCFKLWERVALDGAAFSIHDPHKRRARGAAAVWVRLASCRRWSGRRFGTRVQGPCRLTPHTSVFFARSCRRRRPPLFWGFCIVAHRVSTEFRAWRVAWGGAALSDGEVHGEVHHARVHWNVLVVVVACGVQT